MAYTGAYILGDSLVDSGNALKLAKWYGTLTLSDLPEGAPTPDKGYFLGRFSNGYTFADLLSNKAIGLVSKPVFPFGFEDPWLGVRIAPFAGDPSGNNLNFAYGGAHVLQGDEAVPEFDAQTDAWRDAVDGDADPNALYLITFGGNDVRDLAPTGSVPVAQAQAYAHLQDVAEEMLQEIGQMVEDGARNIVITGMADVGLIPRYDRDGNGVLDATEQMRSDAATDYSIHLDMLIRTVVVPGLQQMLIQRGVDPDKIVYAPIMDYVGQSGPVPGALNANLPTLEALHGLAAGTLSTNLLQHKELVFFDHVHPNAQAHALLASYMQAGLSNSPWVETLPLLNGEVDYRTTGSIATKGEVDKMTIAMVAGTTYRFDMLGVSTVTPFVMDQLDLASIGSGGALLGDTSLRLLSLAGTLVKTDDDSGIGLDSMLAFNAATVGNYTLELSGVGSLTGNYVLTATVTGAAMQAGNTYTVSSPSTLVLEGAGGVGTDTVMASVSYALAAGSEIEALRTTNDKGKTAINLTGNEFGQTIVGNNAANIIEGKGGSDSLSGRSGNDVFVLGNDAVNIDHILDYAAGDIVDVRQILSVAAGTNVLAGGYLRVTTGGLIQVDVDGGGDEWATLSTVNGSGAVALRYTSGGSAATVSASRVSDGQSSFVASHDFDGGRHSGIMRLGSHDFADLWV